MVRIAYSREKKIPNSTLLLSINDQKIDDFLEYQFYNDITNTRKILIENKGVKKEVVFEPDEKIAIELEEPVYRQCENDCDFCFINGLPKGLRKKLYFRDDDYRLSFLIGNFLSLTNISKHDIQRIGRLKLSPLYVSVHTTDPKLRRRIFKNDKAGLIMQHLSSLIDNNINIHCQIVVIPGVTDGVNLFKTITDLSTLYPGISSIGVVPVGKTKHINSIPMVSRKLAQKTISLVEEFHKKFRKKYKTGMVYLADEFYIKAGLPIPETQYYGDFPQYENGIGMARKFINEIKALNNTKKIKGKFLILTGRLALPFLEQLKRRLEKLRCIENGNIDVLAVDNLFFGNSVTVSGLISGADFVRTISKCEKKYDRIILPPTCVNDSGRFIDDKTINDNRIIVSPHNIKELIKCLQ